MSTTAIMSNTDHQYDEAIQSCKHIFIRKTQDYGTSWRVLRTISIVDQVFIKAQRIRTIQQKGVNRVGEDVAGEFQGIVNYGIIGLIQLQLNGIAVEDLPAEKVSVWYDEKIGAVKEVMQDKNHDYGEAW